MTCLSVTITEQFNININVTFISDNVDVIEKNRLNLLYLNLCNVYLQKTVFHMLILILYMLNVHNLSQIVQVSFTAQKESFQCRQSILSIMKVVNSKSAIFIFTNQF